MNNLKRFEDAQNGSLGYETALQEIRNGRKESHWMWYIFPQIKGLGKSYDSRYYSLDSLYEARQYLEYRELGKHLREITKEANKHYENGVYYLMGSDIDVLKFRSSMTLFDVVCPGECFYDALIIFFKGERDEKTLSIIKAEKDYLYADSAFRRYSVGEYQDKGFFETGSYESLEIPRKQIIPTFVDLYLRGERMKDMLHHYLYHRDFSSYRISGVESTLSHYVSTLLHDFIGQWDHYKTEGLIDKLKGWDSRIIDVESTAETFDWLMGILNENVPAFLKDYAKHSIIYDRNERR